MFEPSIILGVSVIVIGAVVWAVRVEGRVNTLESMHNDLKELFDSKLDDIKDRLVRIEKSINGKDHD